MASKGEMLGAITDHWCLGFVDGQILPDPAETAEISGWNSCKSQTRIVCSNFLCHAAELVSSGGQSASLRNN